MADEVGINIELFRGNINRLKHSRSSLTPLNHCITLNRTNIRPFTDDLASFAKAVQLFEKYKTLLDADIQTLKETGESMKEQDERLAQYSNRVSGPQLME